jgi:hypothetical protein
MLTAPSLKKKPDPPRCNAHAQAQAQGASGCIGGGRLPSGAGNRLTGAAAAAVCRLPPRHEPLVALVLSYHLGFRYSTLVRGCGGRELPALALKSTSARAQHSVCAMASSTGLTHLDRVPAEQEGRAATAGRVVWLSHGRCFRGTVRGDAQAGIYAARPPPRPARGRTRQRLPPKKPKKKPRLLLVPPSRHPARLFYR